MWLQFQTTHCNSKMYGSVNSMLVHHPPPRASDGHLPFSAQKLGRPPGVQEVMGSIPVGDSDFALSHACVMKINSHFTTCRDGLLFIEIDSTIRQNSSAHRSPVQSKIKKTAQR